jgi:hypothetical protein
LIESSLGNLSLVVFPGDRSAISGDWRMDQLAAAPRRFARPRPVVSVELIRYSSLIVCSRASCIGMNAFKPQQSNHI